MGPKRFTRSWDRAGAVIAPYAQLKVAARALSRVRVGGGEGGGGGGVREPGGLAAETVRTIASCRRLRRRRDRFTPQLVVLRAGWSPAGCGRVAHRRPLTAERRSATASPRRLADQFPGCGGMRGAGRDEDPPAVGPSPADPPTANPPGPATHHPIARRSPRPGRCRCRPGHSVWIGPEPHAGRCFGSLGAGRRSRRPGQPGVAAADRVGTDRRVGPLGVSHRLPPRSLCGCPRGGRPEAQKPT